ncbi:Outer membrane protein [Sphingobium chlorophenolicum]|uniref:Outer membrane protein n=2 Tax=Sphingobium chlorophenolicum TaxID=46429 RepID=A0A081RBV8_SPHCR|nr:Outer membrane protein [Sphingobium chlorophenolicum]
MGEASRHLSVPSRGRWLAAAVLLAGAGQSATAHANNVVSACSGVSLPKSVLTQTIGDVITPVLAPVESTLNALTFGTINLGINSALSNAAAGAPIELKVLDINGNAVDLATDPTCETTSDSFSLVTPKGISFGGNKITGLGSPGLEASAGELDAIAIGNLASTSVGAFGAVAIGAGASASHAGSVALGSGSVANGLTLNLPAFLVGGTASAEVNIGGRRLTGLAAGANPTDAVNVAQLQAVNDAVGTLSDNAVQYDGSSRSLVTLQGAAGTGITNLSAGAVNATSTDAVNGSQLYATNVQLAYNLTAITDLQEGRAGYLQVNNSSGYAKPVASGADTMAAGAGAVASGDGSLAVGTQAQALAPSSVALGSGSVADGLTLGSSAYLVGGTASAEVNIGGRRLTGLAAGANPTDAVNVAQLQAINDAVGTLSGNAVQYDGGARTVVTLGGVTGTRITNLSAGAVNAVSTDAINGSQLQATNDLVAQNSAAITQLSYDLAILNDLAVKYQDGTKSSILLGGSSGTSIANLAAGSAGSDAVNLSQLDDAVGGIAPQDALPYDPAIQAYNAVRGGVDQKIGGVAAGQLSATSSDAVNGAQLYATNVQLAYGMTAITDLQEGRAGYLQVNNSSGFAKPVASGADTLAAGAGAVASGNGGLALGTQAQALAPSSVALGYASVADRANTVSVGREGAERQIAHVADGVAPTDAVNLRQLQGGMGQAVDAATAYADLRFNLLDRGLRDLRRDAEGGTAASMAMAGIPQFSEAGGGTLGMGVSTWQGEHAVAMGISKVSDNGRLIIRASAAYNSRNQGGANAGMGIAF